MLLFLHPRRQIRERLGEHVDVLKEPVGAVLEARLFTSTESSSDRASHALVPAPDQVQRLSTRPAVQDSSEV